MSYGDWTKSRWDIVYSTKGYKYEVQWRYRQDPIENLTYYAVQQVRITSLGYSCKNSEKTASIGMGTITDDRHIQNFNVDLPEYGSQTFNVADSGRAFHHNSDGTIDKDYLANLHVYSDVVTGNKYAANTNGWRCKNIASSIEDIDRRPSLITSLNAKEVTQTSAIITFDSSFILDSISYSLNSGKEVNVKKDDSREFRISGLSPNTKYEIKVLGRRKYNQVVGTSKVLTFTTKKPDAPTTGILIAKAINRDSLQIEAFNFLPKSGAKIEKYLFNIEGSSNWIESRSNLYTFTNLQPNTSYICKVKAVDNYGTSSKSSEIELITDANAVVINSIDLLSKGQNEVKINIKTSADQNNSYNYFLYSLDNNNFIQSYNNIFTISGLVPKTSYTLYVKAISNNGKVSPIKTFNFSTKPASPIIESIQIGKVTASSVLIKVILANNRSSEFQKYNYTLQGKGMPEIIGTAKENIFEVEELIPNTDYALSIFVEDSEFQRSAISSITFKTKEDKWIYLSINGKPFQKLNLYIIKDDGKLPKKIYKNNVKII